MEGRQSRGVRTTAGTISSSPARALAEIAHWVPKAVAKAPISRAPRGFPMPMKTLSSPIIRPRIWGGDVRSTMLLCIVPNPAWPIPLTVKRAKERPYQGDQANSTVNTSTSSEPTTKTRPWYLKPGPTAIIPAAASRPNPSEASSSPVNAGPTPRWSRPRAGMNCSMGKARAFITTVTYSNPTSMGLLQAYFTPTLRLCHTVSTPAGPR